MNAEVSTNSSASSVEITKKEEKISLNGIEGFNLEENLTSIVLTQDEQNESKLLLENFKEEFLEIEESAVSETLKTTCKLIRAQLDQKELFVKPDFIKLAIEKIRKYYEKEKKFDIDKEIKKIKKAYRQMKGDKEIFVLKLE